MGYGSGSYAKKDPAPNFYPATDETSTTIGLEVLESRFQLKIFQNEGLGYGSGSNAIKDPAPNMDPATDEA